MHQKQSYQLPEWDSFQSMVNGIWEREYYTNQGPLAVQLETELQQFMQVKHVVCMTNSSIALMIALLACNANGNTAVPSLSHVNIAQSVIWAGGHPVYCDVEAKRPVIDLANLEKSPAGISVIVAVNAFGHACEIEALETLARQNNIKLVFISDSVFGQVYNGKCFGGFGDMEIFSFDQSQLVNAGDGACVATNNDELAARLRNIRSSYGAGRPVPIPYTGNGRMSEIQAGLALLSLKEVQHKIELNKRKAAELSKGLSAAGIEVNSLCGKCTGHNYTGILLRFGVHQQELRHSIIRKLNAIGMVYENLDFYGLDAQAYNKPIGLPHVRAFRQNTVYLPTAQNISTAQFGQLAQAAYEMANK
ncbi:MAG TPA: aminotransferase class I/II-fold pyridoxal phosphate-dependent enzyme [Flavobacteriales bacterium]|nr:aminotransferase class I/II-fold pyridoxal phosphate-dependent enzyme [Flavobacteriales bacterium]